MNDFLVLITFLLIIFFTFKSTMQKVPMNKLLKTFVVSFGIGFGMRGGFLFMNMHGRVVDASTDR